jgi:3'(2'), 5'-bisphosphate nucleotidase
VRAAAPRIVPMDTGLADALSELVARAGAAILALAAGRLDVRAKADQSPLTAADEAADAVIAEGLRHLLPGLPVVSEESGHGVVPGIGSFVLVDPLDGTKEFIAGRKEFTVNLAIVTDRYPVAGFIAVPALGLVYRGTANRGAERLAIEEADGVPKLGKPTPIHTRKAPADGLVAAVSRSHLDTATESLVTRLPVVERNACGSAVKFCRVAEGLVDVYPRLAQTREWDVAAGHAIVVAGGGIVTRGRGQPMSYGHAEGDYAVGDFIAWGDPEAARLFG